MTEEQKLQLSFTSQRGHCLESSFMTEEQKTTVIYLIKRTLSGDFFYD